jgi:hypothetical protein
MATAGEKPQKLLLGQRQSDTRTGKLICGGIYLLCISRGRSYAESERVKWGKVLKECGKILKQ